MPFCIACGVQLSWQDSEIWLTLPGSSEWHLYCRKMNKLGAFSLMLIKLWSTEWRFPASLGNLREKILLGAYSLVLLLQKRMAQHAPILLGQTPGWKERYRWEKNSPPGERSSSCWHLKALPECPALCPQVLLLTLVLASKSLRLKPQKFWKKKHVLRCFKRTARDLF